MADLNVDGAGNVGTTRATTAGTLSFGGGSIQNDLVRQLRFKIESLETELTLQKNENTHLLQQIDNLKNQINRESVFTLDGFNEKELKIILSKVHPDKNNNKQIYTELTKKINAWRKET